MNTGKVQTIAITGIARVLVVDDEEDIRDLVAFNLKTAGMEVLLASNGSEALDLVRNQPPDLVILDLMMPEMDGVSVCEMIRKLPQAAEIPVVMLTAWATDRAKVAGLRAGANEYITKPFSPRELVKRVQELLGEQELLREGRNKLELKHLSIDLKKEEVRANGNQVELTPDEFRTLAFIVGAMFERLNDCPIKP